jgi:lycopene cyclase CruP
MPNMTLTEEILSRLPGDVLAGLRRADTLWQALRTDTSPVSIRAIARAGANAVKESPEALENIEWDVVVCGGTLGIFIAAALQMLGRRVAVIERGILRGREQEWNISRSELTAFLELGLLSEAELERAIATEYNPARVAFPDSPDIWVRDVLNIGVDPVFLLDTLKGKFLAAGGRLLEKTPFEGAVIHPNGVRIEANGSALHNPLPSKPDKEKSQRAFV